MVVPPFLFIVIKLSKFKKQLAKKGSDRHAKANGLVSETFSNIRVVKCFAKENYEQ